MFLFAVANITLCMNLLNVFQRLVKLLDRFYFIFISKWHLEMFFVFRKKQHIRVGNINRRVFTEAIAVYCEKKNLKFHFLLERCLSFTELMTIIATGRQRRSVMC